MPQPSDARRSTDLTTRGTTVSHDSPDGAGGAVSGDGFTQGLRQDLDRANAALPVDPDMAPELARRRRKHTRLRDVVREQKDVLVVIATGGAIGSLGRWGVDELIPHGASEFAWSTFIVNVSGGLFLGLLTAFMLDILAATRYVRPFLGIGVLGGWTTFSTYMFDTRAMLATGQVPTGLILYLGGTLLTGLVSAWVGLVAGRSAIVAVTRWRQRQHGHEVSEDHPRPTDE